MFNSLINARMLERGVMLLAPIFVLGMLTGNPLWFRVEIVTVATFVALERSRLAPLGVLLHVLAISFGFVAVSLSLGRPESFVVASVLLAVVCVAITAAGNQMRWTGSFTYIPVLYMACATASSANGRGLAQLSLKICAYLVCASLPVIFASIVAHRSRPRRSVSPRRHWLALRHVSEAPASGHVEAMIAAALAVGVAASLAEWHHVHYPQWLVWSALSVVTGDVATARAKWRDRIVGAVVGVPAGMLFGIVMPHAPMLLDVVTAATVLTLVAFNQYVVAFGTRCALHAVAIIVAGHAAFGADARVIDVVLGSVIGIVFVIATHRIGRSVKTRCGAAANRVHRIK